MDRELQSGQSNGYFSTMRINLHWLCAAWSVAMTAFCAAQDGAIRAENFQDNLVHVSGQGAEIPGLDLRKVLTPKHWIGDDTVFAARAFDDTKWNALQKTEDSVVAGARVHWVRFHVLPDADLGSLPLTLDISTTAAVSAFLNGRSIVHAPVMPGKSSGVPLGDTLPRYPQRYGSTWTVSARYLRYGWKALRVSRWIVRGWRWNCGVQTPRTRHNASPCTTACS
ncbi:MAG: hypothetical protein IPI07_11420 [Flavobacteriales bacterium]|nr:hypothetical protein [Flavobacteriales bacterium]